MLASIKRFFFQKTQSDFDANEAFRRNQTRYNALYALDPDVLVRHLEAFNRGDICGLERIIDEFEMREDKMRIGAFKMAAAVASKPWEVKIRKGSENDPRAKLHQEVLTKFWCSIETTDAFCRNRKGGLRLLVKQMMSAQSRVYSVHDICWRPLADGSLSAAFTHVPAWCFENRTGSLRYIKNDCDTTGEEMREGEWLVTVGEGVGIAASIIAMAKRLSWNDWLLFSEKCGMPVILGNTQAQRGSDSWNAMARAIRAMAPKTGLLADTGTQLNAVAIGGKGDETYAKLVDTVDRAISALYRGGDLATMSSAPGEAGVNAQAGESELMDADGCAMVSETLRDQVEKFVIRFTCGDFEPLAEIVINPPAEADDIDRAMKIDRHLSSLGVKLSKSDALARYGRTEATDENDALQPPSNQVQDGFNGFANEKKGDTPFQTHEKPFQNARRDLDAQGEGDAQNPLKTQNNASLEDTLLSIMAEEAAKALAKGPASPAPSGETIANSGTSEGAKKGWVTRRKNGWSDAEVEENKNKVFALAKEALSDRSSNNTAVLGKTGGREIEDIKAATGIDTTGFSHSVSSNDIRHANNRHGKESERVRGQIPLATEDFARIPEVYSDYDSITRGSPENNTNLPSIRYSKTFPDGTMVAVDVVADNNKILRYKTGWKKEAKQ